MKKASKSIAMGSDVRYNRTNASHLKLNKIKPVGLTQMIMSSTSKENLSKQSKISSNAKNSNVQRNENKNSKFVKRKRRPEPKRIRFQRKEFLEQEEIDDKLLREELRRDIQEKSPFDVSAFGKPSRTFNWIPTNEDVKRKVRNQEYTKVQSPTDVKDVEVKIVDSVRKSAWTDGGESSLVRPNLPEKPVEAWVLTDLEDEEDSKIDNDANNYVNDDSDSAEGLDNSSAFDTDIEEEFERRKNFDQSCEEIYEKICSKKGIVPVSYVMKRLSSAEILIPHHGLGPEGAKALTETLMQNTYVETLDLTDNDIQQEGGFAFASMLDENMYITDLNLSENFLHSEAGIAISKALTFNTTVKRLSLKGNHLRDKVGMALAETLKENRTLAELDISYNEFGETGGLYLGAGLSLNYGLKILNLKWNSIGGKGAVSIAHALATNESLTSLDVSWNSFGYTGSLALSTNLPKNECLKHLDLRNNHIRENAVRKMMPAFISHPNIVEIKLGLNPIGPGGVEAVLEAAKDNPRIKHVGLEDIPVPVKLLPLIEELKSERDATIITDKQTMKSVPEAKKAGLDILMEFLEENALRLKDMFHQFDKDRSGDISRQEFKLGLKEMGILMDSKQLDTLIKEMDTDNNDTIDYSEILGGHKLARKKKRRQTLAMLKSEKRYTQALIIPELDTIKSGLAFT